MTQAIPPQVQADINNTMYCRTCSKLQAIGHAAAALADGDDLTASAYFRLTAILDPARTDHVRRVHPALHEYERQVEQARQAVLGIPH